MCFRFLQPVIVSQSFINHNFETFEDLPASCFVQGALPWFGFVWCFFMKRFALCIFGRNVTEVMLYFSPCVRSQCVNSGLPRNRHQIRWNTKETYWKKCLSRIQGKELAERDFRPSYRTNILRLQCISEKTSARLIECSQENVSC